jgi:peptidyl-prolyl cis-trans isomerase SurA
MTDPRRSFSAHPRRAPASPSPLPRLALLALIACAVTTGGCGWLSVPRWVPWLGAGSAAPPPPPQPVVENRIPSLDAVQARALLTTSDESVADRVVAVVNNDAITLGELHESIVMYRQETRGQTGGPSDDELAKQFLGRLIDNRLQLQEAEREKVTVEEEEITDELKERMKKIGAASMQDFEKIVREQGLSMENVRKRLRDSLATAKVVHRKVRLRVSVTERDIDRYFEDNREKLEVGLSYHARHILVQPEDASAEASWQDARRRAEGLRAQLVAGGDFAEVAKAFSKDASAADGGDLGTLKRGELAQDIETQILALKPGEISAPYRSTLGWHLFRLESKDTLDGDGLVRVRQQIRDILFRQKFEARQDAWLKEIKQRAIIEFRM